jgi:hypothetical protein
VPVTAIDLDDAAHTESYVQHVSVWETLRKERRQLKAGMKLADEADLERFVHAWDQVFFPTKGLRAVEEARERAMTLALLNVPAGKRAVAIVPLERLPGIHRRMLDPSLM